MIFPKDGMFKMYHCNIKSGDKVIEAGIGSGDVTKDIKEKNVDSVIFDIPNPEDAIKCGYSALRLGGYLAVYIPTINQFERAVREME